MAIFINLIAALCLLFYSTLASAQDKVTIGSAKAIGSAASYIALYKGYFKEQGIDADIVDFNSSANAMVLLAQGTMPVVEGGISAGLFNSIIQNMPAIIVGDRVSTPVEAKILIRKDLVGKINNPGDLRDKIVASNGPGAITTYEVGKLILPYGIRFKDLDVKILGFPQMKAAFVNGGIDAALAVQPFANQFEEDGIAKIFANVDDFVKPLTVAVVMYNTEWAKKNPNLANRFYVAYMKGVYDYCQAYHSGSNRKEIIDIMIKSEIETRLNVINDYPWPGRNTDASVYTDSLLDIQKYYLDEGIISKELPLDRLVTDVYAKYAQEKLGKFQLENKNSKLDGCR